MAAASTAGPPPAGHPGAPQHLVLRRRARTRFVPASTRPAALYLRRGRRGLDESTALFEARRCLSCGNCFQCDNCFGVCPDNAVMKVDEAHGYLFDYDFCKGCGLCVQECPCGAIEMVPEEI